MPDPDDRTTETEKLAATVNDTLQSMDETLGCLFQGCWWSALGCLGFGIVGTVVGGSFSALEQKIGFIPTVVAFALAAWLAVHLYRRSRSDRGGRPT